MACPTGRGHGHGRRGRGGHAGSPPPPRSPSPAPSSSSEEAPTFEFVLRTTDKPLAIKKLPDKFIEFIRGEELDELHLKEATCNFCRWPVDVLYDGLGKMYPHNGWEKFTRVHNLSVGCLLTFLYDGNGEMNVKVFDETCCRWHYHNDDGDDEA